MLYDAYSRVTGKRCYMRLEIIGHNQRGLPIYGWPSGGHLDPLWTEAGGSRQEYEIRERKEED